MDADCATNGNGYIINGSGHIAYKTERSTFQIPNVTQRFTDNINEIQRNMTF